VIAFFLGLWLMANLAGWSREVASREHDPLPWQAALAEIGSRFTWMNLPSNPFGEHTWYFNPFAGQLIFFTGFAFRMGWLPAPKVRRWIIWLAVAYVLAVVPFAWFKIHQGIFLPADWAPAMCIKETRTAIEPLWWKSWIGGLRYLHFLALAYVACIAVGPMGVRLSQGLDPRGPAPRWGLWLAGAVALVTVPYSYIDEIKALSPGLDRWFFETIPIVHGDRVGLVQILHLVAVIVLVWAAIGLRAREWLARDLVLMAVPVIRKIGTQSLAVFMASIPLARFNGWVMDMIGRDPWSRAAVNLAGLAALITVAYAVAWFKRQPWRAQPPAAAAAAAAQPGTADGARGADGRGRPPLAAMRA